MNYQEKIKKSAELIKNSRFAIAFTGAGISTESGIPDFRSSDGIWKRFKIVTYQEFLTKKDAREEFWRMKQELLRELLGAKPNKAHNALAELEQMGLIRYVITQNIDGLHEQAGSKNIILLHGSNHEAICLGCDKTFPISNIYARLNEGEKDILCYECGGIIKPKVVFFGEPMPQKELFLASSLASQCDLMLVIGSSLQVEPAASIPRITFKNGGKLIFVNKSETDWDYMAEIIFHQSAGEVLMDILNRLKN